MSLSFAIMNVFVSPQRTQRTQSLTEFFFLMTFYEERAVIDTAEIRTLCPLRPLW